MNYSIGDTVLYGSDGVCKIDGVSEKKIGRETFSYYILKPIYDEKSTIYVPVGNKKLIDKMKRILSECEIYAAIDEAKNSPAEWQSDDTARKEHFKEVIDSGSISEIIKLIRILYLRKRELAACGKKLRVTDEIILKECEKILFDEFALVLKIKRNQVQEFLAEKLGI